MARLPELGAVTAALRDLPSASGGRAEQHPYKALAVGEVEGRSRKMCILSALGNLLKILFWEVRGLVVVSILLLTAVPLGNGENKIGRTEG